MKLQEDVEGLSRRRQHDRFSEIDTKKFKSTSDAIKHTANQFPHEIWKKLGLNKPTCKAEIAIISNQRAGEITNKLEQFLDEMRCETAFHW
jgi:hypothetical protein